MFKTGVKLISNNLYVLLGIVLGLYISHLISEDLEPSCTQTEPVLPRLEPQSLVTAPNLVAPSKKTFGNGKKPKPIRPRYYSTELGIKEKIFVGIFTSEEKVNSLAIHLNKTIGHLVDRIKFFITAQYKLKTKFNLTGLVGFTDTRHKFRPFQVFKYVGDNFVQDYDYYLFTNDFTFINAHRLNDLLKRISVSADIYMGTMVTESSYCDLAAGIVISNSVLRAIRDHLDWCVMNAISEDHSENIGRCIHHSVAGLSCQETVQGQSLASYKLRHFDLQPHLAEISRKPDFNQAITIYPILQSDNFYLLNAYFLRERLIWAKQQIEGLSSDLEDVWPPGQRPGAHPATRFDLPRQFYFNMTHLFFPDDFINIRSHSEPDLNDIKNVIDEVVTRFLRQNPQNYQFRRLINGYRTFDLSRGLDYVLDLGFRDLTTGKELLKRFEVSKPLGKVEFIPVPYVTENTRVTTVLPIQEFEIPLALEFLNHYSTVIMDRKEKSFLMLALLYKNESINHGDLDVFNEIKAQALKLSAKYKNEDLKIAWVSIRLPTAQMTLENCPSLNFALVDLALKKIGLDSLILTLDSYADVTGDFMNRVRMNTIPGFQVFSPIPFRQYDPKITQNQLFDINKSSGHFDREEYKYIAFYSQDYVTVRKKFERELPIIRVDNDIANLMNEKYQNLSNIFEMFVKYGVNSLHCMRATEMHLKIKYHDRTNDRDWRNLFLANDAQLAKSLLNRQSEIPNLI